MPCPASAMSISHMHSGYISQVRSQPRDDGCVPVRVIFLFSSPGEVDRRAAAAHTSGFFFDPDTLIMPSRYFALLALATEFREIMPQRRFAQQLEQRRLRSCVL